MGPLAWLLWSALGIAVVTDWRERKIYNWLTFPAFALALSLRMVGYGFDGPGTLSEGLFGAAIGFVPFFVLAWKGGMGMGDVKLIAVVGACLGWERMVPALFCISVVGGLQGVLALLWTGSLRMTSRRMWILLGRGLRLTTEAVPPARGITVPYGVAIAIGTVWAVWLGP